MNDAVDTTTLPEPPPGKTGWPWTFERMPASGAMPLEAMPTICIVTPSFNQAGYLEETIRSVLAQGYPKLQYLVIDGGSSDGSVKVIKKYEPFIDYWVSQPDRGQSHAINKGLTRCRGEVFNWINSDDLLTPGALFAVADCWSRYPGSLVAGPVVNFREDGVEEVIHQQGLTLENFVTWGDRGERAGFVWHQPGIFLPLSALKDIGGVREDLHYTMDRFMMIELLQRCDVQVIEQVLARFRLHDESKTVGTGHRVFHVEFLQTLRRMDPLPKPVTRRQLDDELVRALVECAEVELRQKRRKQAAGYLKQAMGVAPGRTVKQLWRRRWIGRMLGRG